MPDPRYTRFTEADLSSHLAEIEASAVVLAELYRITRESPHD